MPNLLRLAPLLLLALPAFAQQPPYAPPSGPITLDVTVDDHSGAPVSGLTQQDFTLLDNKHPQPIKSFRVLDASAEQTRAILLIDAVNIDYTGVSRARQDIQKFLHSDDGKLALPTSLAVLQDSGVQMQQGYSRDGNQLSADFDKAEIGLRTIHRSAGFYGADDRVGISLKALRQLLVNAATMPGRKIILFVSPGWPILSGVEVELTSKQQQQIFTDVISLSDLLERAHATIYAINPIGAGANLARENYYEGFVDGVTKPGKTAIGDLSLQVLALHSGGLVMNGSNDVSALLHRAVTSASVTYRLTFDPPPPDPSVQYHHIEIKLDKPGLKPRTLDGYYTQR